MSDLQLRRTERRASQGDPDAAARQLLLRVRAGQLPHDHLVWAAHLGDPLAKTIVENPRVLIDCLYCRTRRERWESDKRLYKAPVPYCNRCNNTTRSPLDRGLMRFVKYAENVPLKILIAWACDCAERRLEGVSPKNPDAFSGRHRLPNQPLRDPTFKNVIASTRSWLHTDVIDQLIFQNAQTNTIARAVAQSGIESESQRTRNSLAGLVSQVWDNTRVERTWQEGRLIKYLLGYLG